MSFLYTSEPIHNAQRAVPPFKTPATAKSGNMTRIQPGGGKRALGAWVYVPTQVNPDSRPLVAVHGISRRAKEQVQLFSDIAERTGRIVIAPLFDRRNWRHYQRITNKYRGDRALLDLLARIEMHGLAPTRKFDLFGYSGGAQFAHRFAMLFPQRIGKLSIAAPGVYCMPDTTIAYPYGLAPRPGRKADWGPRMQAGLDAYLRLPINIMVGAKDTQVDQALRRSPELDANQGHNRLERARRYHAALSELAQQRAIRPQISFTLLAGCGHSFSQCVKTGGLDRLVLG